MSEDRYEKSRPCDGFFWALPEKKASPEKGGCTNQIPLTIKPYPMKNQI